MLSIFSYAYTGTNAAKISANPFATRHFDVELRNGNKAKIQMDTNGRTLEIAIENSSDRIAFKYDQFGNVLRMTGIWGTITRADQFAAWKDAHGRELVPQPVIWVKGGNVHARFGSRTQIWKVDGTIEIVVRHPGRRPVALTGKHHNGSVRIESIEYQDGLRAVLRYDQHGPIWLREADGNRWSRLETPDKSGAAVWQSSTGKRWKGRIELHVGNAPFKPAPLLLRASHAGKEAKFSLLDQDKELLPRDAS